MGFTKKTWKNRIAEYINRRLITMEDGSTNLVTVARDEGTISQEGDAFNAANMNDLEDRIEAGFADVSQSLTTVNNSKRTYLNLALPNVAADAKAVCDYINKNYLMGQITPICSIEFDVVASNEDWFSGVLSTDLNVDSNTRTVWGIVQRRSISADNSTLYKYFGSGVGHVGSVRVIDETIADPMFCESIPGRNQITNFLYVNLSDRNSDINKIHYFGSNNPATAFTNSRSFFRLSGSEMVF